MGMFSDFVDDLNYTQANKGLLDYFLNEAFEDVPENFGSYQPFTGNSYILAPEKEMQITFSYEELPSELKKKGIKDSETLGKYLYSTQQSMTFENVKMSSDGYEIDPTKILLEPFNEEPFPIKKVGRFFIIPQKFPEPHPVEFTFGNEKETFYLERQPSEDYSKVWLKTVDEKPITLSFLFDEHTGKMNLSIDFGIRKSKSIDQALMYSRYTDSFFNGDFSISGEPINGNSFNNELKSRTPFLEIVKDIEIFLQNNYENSFQFDPNIELSHDEYIEAHKLYYSFILTKAFKSNNNIDSLTLQKDSIDPNILSEIITKTQEKELGYFMSTRSEKISLFGKDINIKIAESFSGISMIKYTEVDDMFIVSIKQNENYFSSSIYFLDGDSISDKIKEENVDFLSEPEDIKFV